MAPPVLNIQKKFVEVNGSASVDTREDCSICYAESELVLGCKHQFCNKCVLNLHFTNFLEEKHTNVCPLCRTEIKEVYKIINSDNSSSSF